METTTNKSPVIAIVGGTLWGNRGAEAMLVTTIGQLRRRLPGARVCVFSYYPQRDARLCRDPSIAFYNCRPLNLVFKVFPLALFASITGRFGIRLPNWLAGRDIAALRDCNVLCDIGGITFCDGRELFLPFNVLSVLPAMLLGVPVIKLSQAMGPFRNRVNRFFASPILSRCRRIFSRGSITASHLRELGIERGLCLPAADVAFSWEDEFSLTRENEESLARLDQLLRRTTTHTGKTVAIIPSSLVMKKRYSYIPSLAELAVDLVAAGIRVLLLPNATREGVAKGRNNDLVAIRQVIEWISAHSPDSLTDVVAVDFDVNTSGIRRLMRHADIVVTSRFHAMVAALASGIPPLVIGWSHKYQEVLSQFECDELGIDHRQTGNGLTRTVLELLGRQPVYEQRIRDSLIMVQRSSASQFDEVARISGSRRNRCAERRESTVTASPARAVASQS